MTETTPTPAPVAAPAPAAAPATSVLSTISADVAKAKADIATAKADVVAADGKVVAYIKAHASAIAVGVLVAGALLVWKLI